MTAHARPGDGPAGGTDAFRARPRNGRAVADPGRTVESARADVAQIKEKAQR